MNLLGIWQYKASHIIKMWLNQFAFSLFGLFVASPFNGWICILAGIFSCLFYLSVVGYFMIDDGQKDKIAYNAGRIEGRTAFSGFKYAFVSFLPTYVIYAVFLISYLVKSSFFTTIRPILYLLTRFVLCGEVLGIDAGLTNFTYSQELQMRISNASDFALFLSEYAIIQIVFAVLVPVLLGIIYYLSFIGKISINTTSTKK